MNALAANRSAKPARTRRIAIGLWLTLLTLCLLSLWRTSFTADMSAFLPQSPTAEQQLLVDQLREGAVSRLILIGIQGGEAADRAELSRALSARLRSDGGFTSVANGETEAHERDREILFANRYVLSPAASPERYTAQGLEAALQETLANLASPAGLLLKSMLREDPTGEMLQLLQALEAGDSPASTQGVWASRDSQRALLLAHTRATGSDTDAQAAAIAAIENNFAELVQSLRSADNSSSASVPTLLLSGPGVFSVRARDTIRNEVSTLATLSAVLVSTLLLVIYRSPLALVLGLVPVVTGVLAGIAAVNSIHGAVHGITLGFGITLIGEAVDYAIYLFVQTRSDKQLTEQSDTLWRTLRLGVATSVVGFGSLLFSGFPGLAQLGVFSITGLLVAALTTRFVLPHLLPASFRVRDARSIGLRLARLVAQAPRLRPLALLAALAAVAVIGVNAGRIWNHQLGALSPVSAADEATDTLLRGDIGAPNLRYLVVVQADTAENTLQAAERAGTALDALVDAGVLAGYNSPARLLPSMAMQARRQAAIPSSEVLRRNLQQATADLPLRAERLDAFIEAAVKAKTTAPLTRDSLAGSSLLVATDALLLQQNERWTALLPLRTAEQAAGKLDAERVRAALPAGVHFLDLKKESNQLYSGYLNEAIVLSALGALSILLLLAFARRSLDRMWQLALPLATAVLLVVAGLLLAGKSLTLLHLVGLLLVVAVGSNYALFFDSQSAAEDPAKQARTLASLLFANLTTVTAFGLLAASSVPILQAIGGTVGPGALLSLVLAAILMPRRHVAS